MNKALIALVVILLLGGGAYVYTQSQPGTSDTASLTPTGEESGSVKPDTITVVTENMTGKWQSTEDAKFVRELKEGDAYTDWYDNETTDAGLWAVFTKSTGLEVPFPLEDNAVYVQMTKTGSPEDTLYFKVTMSADANSLQMYYLGRGGVLDFKRI